MRLIVNRKELKLLRAAVTIKHFDLDFDSVVQSMMLLQCRKEHIVVKVMTMWYKR